VEHFFAQHLPEGKDHLLLLIHQNATLGCSIHTRRRPKQLSWLMSWPFFALILRANFTKIKGLLGKRWDSDRLCARRPQRHSIAAKDSSMYLEVVPGGVSADQIQHTRLYAWQA